MRGLLLGLAGAILSIKYLLPAELQFSGVILSAAGLIPAIIAIALWALFSN